MMVWTEDEDQSWTLGTDVISWYSVRLNNFSTMLPLVSSERPFPTFRPARLLGWLDRTLDMAECSPKK